MTRGSAMGQLYDWMIQNNIDQVSPISAVKVSGITPVKFIMTKVVLILKH